MRDTKGFLGGYGEMRRMPKEKHPILKDEIDHSWKSLSLVEVTEKKDEHALFYNIFLPSLDKAKAEEIVGAMLDKKPVSPELETFLIEALDKYNKVRKDVEFVKDIIDEKLIEKMGAYSKDLGELLKRIPASQAVKYFKVRRLFEMAIENPPDRFEAIKKNMKKIPERLRSDDAKHLEEKIKKLTKELGIDEKKFTDIFRRDKSLAAVHWDLYKATAAKYKGWEHVRGWFKTFWKRRSLLRAVAAEIRLAERCHKELGTIGDILAASIDPDTKDLMYQYSLEEDPGKKDPTWPPNMLMTRKDLERALKEYGPIQIKKKWREKVGEYKKDRGIESGKKGGRKLTAAELADPDLAAMKAKFLKDQIEGHEKLLKREGPTNVIYRRRIDALADNRKPSVANFTTWIDEVQI